MDNDLPLLFQKRGVKYLPLLLFSHFTEDSSMLSLKKLFWPELPKPINDEELRQIRIQRIRNIVARVSSGNVSLQRGAFMTSADVEKLRQKNEEHGLCK